MIEDPPVSASPVDVVADACRRHSATRADLMGPLKTKWLTKARREVEDCAAHTPSAENHCEDHEPRS